MYSDKQKLQTLVEKYLNTGDKKVLGELAQESRGYTRHIWTKYGGKFTDWTAEDFHSEVAIKMQILLDAGKYDPERADFYSYLFLFAKGELCNYLRKLRNEKNRVMYESTSLSIGSEFTTLDQFCAKEYHTPDILADMVSAEVGIDIVDELEKHCTNFELFVLLFYLQNCSYDEIVSKMLYVLEKKPHFKEHFSNQVFNQKSVDNAMTRIKAKLKKSD